MKENKVFCDLCGKNYITNGLEQNEPTDTVGKGGTLHFYFQREGVIYKEEREDDTISLDDLCAECTEKVYNGLKELIADCMLKKKGDS